MLGWKTDSLLCWFHSFNICCFSEKIGKDARAVFVCVVREEISSLMQNVKICILGILVGCRNIDM